MEVQIIGIRKPGGAQNTHEAISHYQWRNPAGEVGISTREEMVSWIMQNPSVNRAYVLDRQRNKAYCKVVRNDRGTVFLQTYPDGTVADNLLNLPPC